MQPPLPIGTVLQNRYRLLKILGQGGFGRTYLAEDQGRFNELCALKELILTQTSVYTLEKSKEFFQREASTLYQIQHPQIPQFRATLEQDRRLFLVQDYVEGDSYRALLSKRKTLGQKFSEIEVLQFLQQMLPVLDYIHNLGIIHRDISPDNIILREKDRLPVLIDFGVVKELATKVQFSNTAPAATTVGKPGYAPSEQIQTGRAYPSSDLYALAVTCIVLLTGQEPQVLFDETTLSWNWYRWIPPINPGLIHVLNQMLSYKPSDRYQSAREVAQALQQAISNPAAFAKTTAPQPTTALDPNLSLVQTLAVGRRSDPNPDNENATPRPKAVIPTPHSTWDNPWVVVLVGLGLALFAGVGSWALVSTILKRQPQVRTAPIQAPVIFDTPTASPTPTATPENTPAPTPSPEPITVSQRLEAVVGETVSVSGNLKANTRTNYIFAAQEGQQLSVLVEPEAVLMTILEPNEQPVNDTARQVRRWEGSLPLTGNYTLQLETVNGGGATDYKLDFRLSSPEATPTPTPTATPTPTETPSQNGEFDVETLNLPRGSIQTQLSGRTSPQKPKRYLVNVQEGQVLSARLQSEGVTLDVRYPDGQLVENASGLGEWEGKVEQAGEYQVDVNASQETDFTIYINVSESP